MIVLCQVGHAEGEESGAAGAGEATVGAGECGHHQHQQLQQLPAPPQQHPLIRGHSPPHGKSRQHWELSDFSIKMSETFLS